MGAGDGVGGVGPVLVGEGQWLPGLAQVPDEVGGEHADEHVRPHPGLGVVVDRPQVQVDAFQGAEVPFD